ALLMLAALTVYLVRDQFRPASKQERIESAKPISAQPLAGAQASVDSAGQPSPTSTVAPSAPVKQPSSAVAQQAGAELPSSPSAVLPEGSVSSTEEATTNQHLATKADGPESQTVANEHSHTLSIQDVTGSARGPVLKKMKPIQLSRDAIDSLGS